MKIKNPHLVASELPSSSEFPMIFLRSHVFIQLFYALWGPLRGPRSGVPLKGPPLWGRSERLGLASQPFPVAGLGGLGCRLRLLGSYGLIFGSGLMASAWFGLLVRLDLGWISVDSKLDLT